MLLNIQISSTELKPIKNFRYILQMARGMKCNLFYVSKETNAIYGTFDEAYAIHECKLTHPASSDMVFSYSLVDMSIVDRNGDVDYFIPEKFQWAAIPVTYWEQYISGDIYEWYHPETGSRYLVSKSMSDFVDYIIIIRMNQTYESFSLLVIQVHKMWQFMYHESYPPITFNDMESNEVVREVFDNKVALGRKLLTLLSPDGRQAVFYIFKTLFALNKNDKLTIDIHFSKMQRNIFMAVFTPIKKKRPAGLTFPFQERVYCMYLNLVYN